LVVARQRLRAALDRRQRTAAIVRPDRQASDTSMRPLLSGANRALGQRPFQPGELIESQFNNQAFFKCVKNITRIRNVQLMRINHDLRQ